MIIPDELTEQLGRGEVPLFIGAGISRNAGLPGWLELIKRRLQHHRRAGESFAEGAVLLGFLGEGLEARHIDLGNIRLSGEADGADGVAFIGVFELDLGIGADHFWAEASFFEVGRERHREATGVGGADEFLRISARSPGES